MKILQLVFHDTIRDVMAIALVTLLRHDNTSPAVMDILTKENRKSAMLIDNTIELLRGNFPVPRHGGFSLRRRDSQHTEVTVSAEHTRDWHYSIISQHVNVALIMNV